MDFVTHILLFIGGMALGFVFGYYLAIFMVYRNITKAVANLLNELSNEAAKLQAQANFTHIVTETHGRTIFAYDALTQNFICQGETIEEVAKNLYEFKKIDNALITHNEQLMFFIDGKKVENLNDGKNPTV